MSRLIRGGQATAGCVAWQAPEVGEGTARAAGPDLETLRREAREAGHAQGLAEGRDAAARELAARIGALEQVLDALARPLEDLDQRVETELLALVEAISRALLRREVHRDPEHIVGVIREGLAALPLSAEDVCVRLHPDDVATVHDCLPAGERDRAWRVEADPLMERGGCLIVSSRSTVDCRPDVRLGRVIAALFEDERSHAG